MANNGRQDRALGRTKQKGGKSRICLCMSINARSVARCSNFFGVSLLTIVNSNVPSVVLSILREPFLHLLAAGTRITLVPLPVLAEQSAFEAGCLNYFHGLEGKQHAGWRVQRPRIRNRRRGV